MADEKIPEQPDALLPPEGVLPEEKKEAPAEPAFAPELKKIMDMETFWNGADAQTSATVVAPIDPPEQIGDVTSFRGNIVFKEFPSSAKSFTGDAKLIHGMTTGQPNASLVLSISGILDAIAVVAKEYIARGEKPSNAARNAAEALPIVFSHVFKAIKEKSPKIYWSKSNPQFYGEGKSIPLVAYVYDKELDKELGVNLTSAFESMKSQINSKAEEILSGGSSSRKEKKRDPWTQSQSAIRKFVLETIPEDRYEMLPGFGMVASMPVSVVEQMGGKELAEVIRKTPLVGDFHQRADEASFWYRYDPDTDKVTFKNKRLTSNEYVKQVKQIYQQYRGEKPLFNNIADKMDVPLRAVEDWFKKLLNEINPDTRKKVADILGVTLPKEKGIKKEAYPDVPWAGPDLTQIGGLIGDSEAAWASELAGALAAKLDYISLPSLEGGPSSLRKLATLPLTPEQIARVERFRSLSMQMLSGMLAAYPLPEVDPASGEVVGFAQPSPEEATIMAEDILLALVENTPSTMPDDEFKKELKTRLNAAARNIQQRHQQWPSMQSSPEDAMHAAPVGYDPVADVPEVPEMTKQAGFANQKGDHVKIIDPTHPHAGKKGVIEEIWVDVYMCPEHGPESAPIYYVKLEDGTLTEAFAGDVIPAQTPCPPENVHLN